MSKVKGAKSTTAVVKFSDAGNVQIPDLLTGLKQELQSLQKVNDTPYKTSMRLEGFGDLKGEKKVENLIRAYSMIIAKEENYNKAQDELGVAEAPAFKIDGATREQWKDDIQLQIKKVTYEARYNELKDLIKEAEQFLSQEDKKTLFFRKLQAKLGADKVPTGTSGESMSLTNGDEGDDEFEVVD